MPLVGLFRSGLVIRHRRHNPEAPLGEMAHGLPTTRRRSGSVAPSETFLLHTSHFLKVVRSAGMKHEPSNYTGTITLTFQQMCEVHKAISDRLMTLMRRDYEYKEQDIASLLEVVEMLVTHTNKGIAEWEERVAKLEAQDLDNDLRDLLDGE